MKELKDTQNERDDRNLAIDRVGVKGLRFPVEVRDKGGATQRTVSTVALAVDLPHHYKGTHMSRFVEVLNSHGSCIDVRTMANLPRELLKRLDARKAHVEFQFPFFRSKAAPVTGQLGLMDYEVRFEVEAELLGQLHHPGIAHIFAAHPGDETIPPFIAMELVDGPPVTDYAVEHHLDARAKVEVMIRWEGDVFDRIPAAD